MKKYYLLLSSLVFFTNCQKENINNNSPTQIDSTDKFLEVKIMEIDDVFQAVPIARSYNQKENKRTKQRSASENDFEILGDDVIYVSDGVNESYTFQIQKDQFDLIENLIIISSIELTPKNKIYNAYITTYNLSLGDEISLDKEEDIALLENASIYSVSLDNIGALVHKRDAECYEIAVVNKGTEKSRATG